VPLPRTTTVYAFNNTKVRTTSARTPSDTCDTGAQTPAVAQGFFLKPTPPPLGRAIFSVNN